MTLEIPTELEAQLRRAAHARGTDAQTLLLEAARYLIESAPTQAKQSENEGQETRSAKRRRLAIELRGSASGGSPTVDEFLRERSEEARKEMLREEQKIAQSNEGLST